MEFWREPRSKSVGLFTDFSLYYDALKLCRNLGVVNINVLQKELSKRIIGMRYVQALKKRAFMDLARELHEFGYLQEVSSNKNATLKLYILTPSGEQLMTTYESNKRDYLRHLANNMNKMYIIPSWFVNRLWEINPTGQGQVIIPTPLKDWSPPSCSMNNFNWSEELEYQVKRAFQTISDIMPKAFPVKLDGWILKIKNEYERLGAVRDKKMSTDKKQESFAPRRRLAAAMRTASLELLFGNSYKDKIDFKDRRPKLNERSYMAWCPRLENLEFIFYSDYFKGVPGRLLFPISVFREDTNDINFEKANEILSPDTKALHYFHPKWENFKMTYIHELFTVYQMIHNVNRILYVPLQDVRDEVCRKLRLSSHLFETFLEESFKESLLDKIDFSIALETDVREDQRSGSQILRRPVYVQGIPHSLIAINIIR